MTLQTIFNNTTAKDKKRIADLYDVSVQYINQLLSSSRKGNSETAKRILKDLEIAANINMLTEAFKENQLNKAA